MGSSAKCERRMPQGELAESGKANRSAFWLSVREAEVDVLAESSQAWVPTIPPLPGVWTSTSPGPLPLRLSLLTQMS